MRDLLDVVKVEVLQDYQLLLEFENGEKRLFDMKELMAKRPFCRLEGAIFRAAKVACGTVVWPGNVDIAPETLYDRSVPQ